MWTSLQSLVWILVEIIQRLKLLFRWVEIYDNYYLKISVHNPFSYGTIFPARTSIWHCPTTSWLQTANSFCLLLQVFWFCRKFVSRWTVECFGFLCKNHAHGQWDDHPIDPATQRIILKIFGFLLVIFQLTRHNQPPNSISWFCTT